MSFDVYFEIIFFIILEIQYLNCFYNGSFLCRTLYNQRMRCARNGGNKKMRTKYWPEDLKGRYHLGRRGHKWKDYVKLNVKD